ncbi:MAG: hypothetical protein ABIG95_00870 [Candidatus Woesearchaeota archaeon]
MSIDNSVQGFIEELRECDDPKTLENRLQGGEEFPVFFYGYQAEIMWQLYQLGKEEIADLWQISKGINFWGDAGTVDEAVDPRKFFWLQYTPGDVKVQVNTAHHWLYRAEQNWLFGEEHSVFTLFFMVPKTKELNGCRAIALAAADLLEYAIGQQMTFRLPSVGINHIPCLEIEAEQFYGCRLNDSHISRAQIMPQSSRPGILVFTYGHDDKIREYNILIPTTKGEYLGYAHDGETVGYVTDSLVYSPEDIAGSLESTFWRTLTEEEFERVASSRHMDYYRGQGFSFTNQLPEAIAQKLREEH